MLQAWSENVFSVPSQTLIVMFNACDSATFFQTIRLVQYAYSAQFHSLIEAFFIAKLKDTEAMFTVTRAHRFPIIFRRFRYLKIVHCLRSRDRWVLHEAASFLAVNMKVSGVWTVLAHLFGNFIVNLWFSPSYSLPCALDSLPKPQQCSDLHGRLPSVKLTLTVDVHFGKHEWIAPVAPVF